jgi:hypothetical protein
MDATVLFPLFSGLVLAAVEAELACTLGIEQAATVVASLFLVGALRSP